LVFSPIKNTRYIFSFLVAALLFFTQGCGSESDVAIVDFTKTVAIEKPENHPPESPLLKVAVAAMISPKETSVYYRQVLNYIGGKLGREIQLIQRKTYGEVNELFGKGQIDLAFICSGPYAATKEKYGFEALATPLVRGKPFYQSYLIVNTDSPFQKLEDLRERVFAFTDPESNTGRLVPVYWLSQMGESPESFFGKTIYTYSHDNSILAVAKGLVDGAAIDGHIWEYYNDKNPENTSTTRIIRKSAPYGNPPVVVSDRLPIQEKIRIRQLLISMHLNPAGKKILDELMIDSFVEPKEEWYDPIRRMKETLSLAEETPRASAKP
jgi:phosphonate transport system substrate-binding protein